MNPHSGDYTSWSYNLAGLLRMTNNNIIHHIGFYGLTLFSDNYTELHVTSIIHRLNSNNTDSITTSAPKGSGRVGFEGVSGPDPKLKIKPA